MIPTILHIFGVYLIIIGVLGLLFTLWLFVEDV